MELVRVLHIVGSLGTGGIQTYLMNLYRNIDRSRVQFDFVVHIKEKQSYASEIKLLGGRVFYVTDNAFVNKSWKSYIKFWKRFYKEHQEYKIVHSHLRSTSYIYLREAKKAGLYVIAHSHATSNGYGKAAKLKDMLQWPTRYIADYYLGCSEDANIWMFGKKRAKSSNCRVIHNGIDVDKFKFNAENRLKKRVELGLFDTDFVIGNVGRLIPQKNQEILIDAMPGILERKPNAKLLIIGDGVLEQALRKKARYNGVDNNVLMLGSRTDIEDLFSAMDVFVLSSRNEGLGIAVIEAQANGLPAIVSSAIPKEAYITEDIHCVKDNSVGAWVEAVLGQHIVPRRDTSFLMTEAGYSIQEVADELCRFYMGILNQN